MPKNIVRPGVGGGKVKCNEKCRMPGGGIVFAFGLVVSGAATAFLAEGAEGAEGK